MRLIFALALCTSQAIADTDFRALSNGERLLLGQEIRAVLLAHPEIVDAALNPPFEPYAEAIARDIELIEAHRDRLFAGADLALVISPDCESCARAQQELTKLAATYGLTINVVDLNQAPELEQALNIDMLPFYVLPKLMLRGAMPSVVLERYLADMAN